MSRPTVARLPILAFAVCIAAPIVNAGSQVPPASLPPYIETSGFGERRVAPDRATVTISVTTRSELAATAAAENARIRERILDTLRLLGLGSAASTATYNIGRDYEPDTSGRMTRVRTAARGSIRVQLKDISLIGRVIDASLARGATGVDGVYFESSAAEGARRAALTDAATMARADAEALARALNGELGRIVSASTTPPSVDPRSQPMMRAGFSFGGAVSAPPTQITPSELVISAVTTIRWLFLSQR